MSKLPRLRSFEWQPSTGKAAVEFYINENFTVYLTKDGVKKDMSDIYIALFHGGGPTVQVATAKAWGVGQDKFGNPSPLPLVATRLSATEANRVNWTLDIASLELRIIPGIWTVTEGRF